MNLTFDQVRHRHAACGCSFLALIVTTMLPLRGDERDLDPAGKALAGVLGNVESPVGETSAVITTEEAVEPRLTSVTVDVVSGIPFSVGVVELTFAEGHGPRFYRDQPLILDSNGGRIHYAAFDVSYQDQVGKSTLQVDRLRVLFLLRGDQASHISLAGVEGVELEDQKIRFFEDPIRHDKLFQEWWENFSVIPQDLDREQKMLKQSLLEMLARRLNLPGPWPSVQAMDSAGASDLESQFERAIGMLFGIESVKLAMREDADLNKSPDVWISPAGTPVPVREDANLKRLRHREKADRPIPARPRMRSLSVPPVPPTTRIESIAMHVPAECFYLRTGSLANYGYFRRFLLGWGGSLDDIVATRSLDHRTRSKIEFQLGLVSDTVSVPEFDRSISDMALIGCDPFFQDGAAIGVLFRARHPQALFRQIQKQRQQVMRDAPEAMERRVDIGNHAVSLLASDDNRVRSFYAIDGEFHLVTNSHQLLNRFFEAGRGDRSLGALPEFRYSRSKTQVWDNPLAFLYLSDPFFQNLVSPHYRIELTRRRQAAEELKQLQLARMVAEAEQLDAVTVAQLIEKRLLPPKFANRPDKSIPLIENGKLRDSLRGSPQAFLPVPDVPLDKATPSEVYSYQQFVHQYNQEWKRIDPVTVVISRRDSLLHDHDWVNLDIVVTPYAQNRYALLRQHLAPANPHRVAPVRGDLLSLDTSVRTRAAAPSHLLYLGLRDDTVPFAVENGNLRLLARPQQGSYAKSHSYAAISPPSTEVLRLLASVVDREPGQHAAKAPRARQTNVMPPPAGLPLRTVERAFYYLGWVIGKISLKYNDFSQYLSSVETREDWTVVSNHRRIRKSAIDELTEEYVETSPQVRLRMGSLRGAKVEPYIQAYTYLTARRASSENAKFLNDFSRWMHLPAKDARDAVENLLGARLCCPLGGDFALEEANGPPRWVGTDWQEPSLHTVSEIPESWRFPFLAWIHRLNLQFDLGPTTLRAQVDLLVNQASAPAVDGQTVGLEAGAPPHSISVVNHEQNTTDATRPMTTPSPTGTSSAIATLRSSDPSRAPDKPSEISRTASSTRDSTNRRTWVLGIRLATSDQSMRVTEVYPDSPASRAGLQANDEIQAVDRVRPRSHSELVQLLRAALERDGVAVVHIFRHGTLHRLEIPLLDR